jgi:hypothetical protein
LTGFWTTLVGRAFGAGTVMSGAAAAGGRTGARGGVSSASWTGLAAIGVIPPVSGPIDPLKLIVMTSRGAV